MSIIHKTSNGYHVFYCPGCRGAHLFTDKWQFNGDLDKPTISPSILVYQHSNQPQCHSFVREGKIQYLPDSTHSLTGQTINLPDFDDPKNWTDDPSDRNCYT